MSERVPTTVVTGFLGVGKTTAMLDLFGHRPADGNWAVLVNEFGEVGIDGAILGEARPGEPLTVAEVAGGCICCSAGLALRATLGRLLEEVQPTRLLIEPTGLAHPASVIDLLRSPGLRERVDVRAVIGLVDPRHTRSPRHLDSHPWQDQIRIADVLVANKTDLASPEDLAAFHALAAESWPPKLAVAETSGGVMDPAWLDLGPPAEPRYSPEEVVEHDVADLRSRGWVWPPRTVFDREALEPLLEQLLRPEGREGALRLKGVFRVRRGWFLVQGTPDRLQWSPIGHRRDSRVEIIERRADPPTAGGRDIDSAFADAMLRR